RSRQNEGAESATRSTDFTRGPGARLGNEKAREPSQFPARQPSPEKDTSGPVLTLVHRRSELVQLGELRPILVGDEEVYRFVAVGKAGRDPLLELVEPLAGERGELDRIGEPVREAPAPERVDRVDLVHHDLERQIRSADLPEHDSHGCALLFELVVGYGRIYDVKDEIRDQRLFERG